MKSFPLSVLERIAVLNILPSEANYLTYKLVVELKKALSFTDKEFKDWSIVSTADGRVKWDVKKAKNKGIEIPDTLFAILREKLASLEKDGKINDQNVSLYEKFVVNQ